jgi:hypothetical protein
LHVYAGDSAVKKDMPILTFIDNNPSVAAGIGFAALAIVVLFMWMINDKRSTERFSRFQSYIIHCQCTKVGVSYNEEGTFDEFKCARGSSLITYPEFSNFVDENFDIRDPADKARMCAFYSR